MFKEITSDILQQFRVIYHQTTGYSNPIIETALYENSTGRMYYYGDLIDANYFIFHRSGFAHINLNSFDPDIGVAFFREFDRFLDSIPSIPNFLMFYHTPPKLMQYWKEQGKKYFKIRKRRRYQIDNTRFMALDRSLYAIPDRHRLAALQECPYEDLEVFDMALDTRFFNSREDFLRRSFGFVLYNEDSRPVSIGYSMCLIGRNSECDLKTLPEFKNKGYGFITITNYVRESILRKVNVGWDCFLDNHTNKWVGQYGYTHIIREYDFVSFLR